LAAGIAAWWYYPGPLLTRAGYSELFYPPTVGFILTASGVIVLLFFLVDLRAGLAAYQPLRLLGEAALFMYIAHLALIQYFLSSMWPRQPQGTFLVLAAATTVALMVAGGGIRRLKVLWKSRPMPICAWCCGSEFADNPALRAALQPMGVRGWFARTPANQPSAKPFSSFTRRPRPMIINRCVA
jgi:hypothetical protein